MTTFKKNLIDIFNEQLTLHGLNLKTIIITILGMILPFIFPFIGITILVFIDFWTSYTAGKTIGLNLYSKGLRDSIKKWTEYLITLIVCIIVDSIIMGVLPNHWNFYFTHISTIVISVTELKSISENFAGVSLAKVIKIVFKYAISKFTSNKKEISDLLENELNAEKFKDFKMKENLNRQEKNKNKGLKTEDKKV